MSNDRTVNSVTPDDAVAVLRDWLAVSHHAGCDTWQGKPCDCHEQAKLPAVAALDAVEQELGAAQGERDEARAVVEQLRRHGGDWIVAAAVKEIEPLKQALRQMAPLIAGTFCVKRPQFKDEAWDGPCGRCANCRARAVWYDADGHLLPFAHAVLGDTIPALPAK